MTKAYRCDRCRECFDGVPKSELILEGENKTLQLCEKCNEAFERFMEKKEGAHEDSTH